jgi:hypothetical protein
MVLAALGSKHLPGAAADSAFAALKDMLLAWRTARGAVSRTLEQP